MLLRHVIVEKPDMDKPAFDIVIRGGTVATASDVVRADVGVTGERIAALGERLGPGAREIDARGRFVLPGGIDSHCHIEQLSAGGLMNADTWESATAAAAMGGTTTVISFAAQHVGMELPRVLDDYAALARKGALVDYCFHMIVSDATERLVKADLPAAIKAGHASIKLFMTYDRLRVQDEQALDVLMTARENRALVCVHAENHGMIAWMGKRLLDRGYAAPKHHAASHPRLAETEAFERLIAMAALVDQPIMIFHVSTAEGAAIIRRARGEGRKVYGETCPQYLFMTAKDLDRPGLDGAKWMCSPPPRDAADQEALWRALALGDLQTVSSDHAPYRFDASGKLSAGPNPNFKQIANGVPGLQTRLPLLFDAMVSRARGGLESFVALAAAEPARIYGLADRKGSIAIGKDADIAIWNPRAKVIISDAMMLDRTGYTPFAGRAVKGWPETVLRRGEVVVAAGAVKASAGSGRFLPRRGGAAAAPTGRLAPEMDPRRNFGARLY
jgi:dihydropyrimidinase